MLLLLYPRCLYPEDDGGGGLGEGWSRVEDQRKDESAESLKPGKVAPTGPAQRVGSVGRTVEEVFGAVRGCPARGTEGIWGPAHPHQETVKGRAETRAELQECRAVRTGEGGFLSYHPRALSSRTTLSERERIAWVTASV